jgi:hypothetical protein
MKGDGRLGAWQRQMAINTLLTCDCIDRRGVVRATSGLTLITVPFYSTRVRLNPLLQIELEYDIPCTLKKGCYRLKITNFYIIEMVSLE